MLRLALRVRGCLVITAAALALLLGCAAPPPEPIAPPVSIATTALSAAAPTSTATPTSLAPVSPTSAIPTPAASPKSLPDIAGRGDGPAATGETSIGSPDAVADVATGSRPGLAEPFMPAGQMPSPTTIPLLSESKPAGTRARLIALDPGHGGLESGAAAYGLLEKDLNLKIALKLAVLLRDEGYKVVLTRDTDRSVNPDYTGSGYPGVSRDLQARVDIANAAGADLFLSIHNNGSNDTDQAGTEVWYSRLRSFGDRNLALAGLLQTAMVKRIRALGYPVVDRGIKDDSTFRIFRGRAYNIYVLGPGGEGPRLHVPTQMPGALGEALIVSNPGDAAMLRKNSTLDAIAEAYRDAVSAYFEQFPD